MLPRGATYFLYKRASEKCWVIDDVVAPRGNTLSYSAQPRLGSQWSVTPSWEVDDRVTVARLSDAGGYQKEAVAVRIAQTSHRQREAHNKSSLGKEEVGLYLRLPPYDNVNGKPHYLKQTPAPRRHIFYSTQEGCWVLCPICNCLLYTSPSPRDATLSRMPSSA